jgi:hypothetical protein
MDVPSDIGHLDAGTGSAVARPFEARRAGGIFDACSLDNTWGRPGFDSGYAVCASMQSGDERLFKTIITP